MVPSVVPAPMPWPPPAVAAQPTAVSVVLAPQTTTTVMQNDFIQRLDNVVREMEVELTDDLRKCGSPGESELDFRKLNEDTVDFLDNISEKRQQHLDELRRIVAEGRSIYFGDNFSTVPNSSDDDESAAARLPGSSTRQIELLEKQRFETTRELQELRSRVREAEAAAQRHRKLGSEAADARAGAEADLKAFEESSLKVLDDCRALQAKVHDMEKERVAFQDRIGVLEDRARQGSTNNPRILELEQELEDRVRSHEAALDEHNRRFELSALEHQQRHNEHVARITELEGIVEDNTGRHAVHITRITELEDQHARQSKGHRQLIAELEQQIAGHELAVEDHMRQHTTHRSRIQELEQLIANAEDAAGGHTRQHSAHKSRIMELEQQLADLQVSHDNHSRQSMLHRKRIGELEVQLSDVQLGYDNHHREHSVHISRISELERALEDAEGASERHSHQHYTHRLRIQELEQELSDVRAAESGHHRQHNTHKSRIAELEQQIQDLDSTNRTHNRQHEVHRARIAELERALADHDSSGAENQRQFNTMRQRIKDLEEDLEELRVNENNHLQQHSAQRNRITELEQKLLSGDVEQQGHMQQRTVHVTRITELEETLGRTRSEVEQHSQQHRVYRSRIEELERQLAEAQVRYNARDPELERRVQILTQELHEARSIIAALRIEVESLQTIERDAQNAMRKQDDLMEKHRQEWEAKLNQSTERVHELEEQLSQNRAANAGTTTKEVITTSHRGSGSFEQSSVPTMSTAGRRSSLMFSPRRGINEFLPGSSDPFVLKVRDALQVVSEAIRNADTAHALAIESQLSSASEARTSSRSVRESFVDYPKRQIVESEQRTAYSNVEAAMHDLRALKEELQIMHSLSNNEREEIAFRITHSIRLCEDELNLLRSPSTLSELPEPFVGSLLDVHVKGLSADREWSQGLSPMHHATQHGRRDVIAYLMRLDGGRALLNSRDVHGRTPLYYAHNSNQTALEHWLRENAGMTESMHTTARRPSISAIPPQYSQLLNQIETTGWKSVNWKNGYTMLHWAASKGHHDLCRYLIGLDADPNTEDKQSRRPIDLARSAGHSHVVVVLEELRRSAH